MSRRNKKIVIWRKTKGGGRVGTSALVNRRTQRFRTQSKFAASFQTDRDFDLDMDSRHLGYMIGDRLKAHYKKSILADQNPETGQKNPQTYRTQRGRWKERDPKNNEIMARELRRTVTNTVGKWSGKGGRQQISLARCQFRIYPNSLEARALNKWESTRKHKQGRAFYMGTGGKVRPLIDTEIGNWIDLVLDGHTFKPDTKSKAYG